MCSAWQRPNSTEFDADTPDPVIDYLPGQEADGAKGGTMRLGSYPCALMPGTHALPLPTGKHWCASATVTASR